MTDFITDRLRSDILSGAVAPGERLVELALCERYGCGRAAIRSALVVLDGEGLVEREANRGATVRRVSIDEAIEVAETRAALEGFLAARAALRADDADRSDLTEIIADMRAAIDADDASTYSQLNSLLHRRIREISGHETAGQIVANLRDRGAHHAFRLALMPGRPEESVEQHAAIVEAIIDGKTDQAANQMEKHLLSVIDVLQRWAAAT